MRSFLLISLTFTSLFCTAQTWTTTDIGNGLKINFPFQPTERKIDPSRKVYSAITDSITFYVLITEVGTEKLPTDTESELEILDIVTSKNDAINKQLLISETIFEFANKKGLHLVKYIIHPESKEKVTSTIKAFFYRKTLYQISVIDITKESKNSIDSISTFFNSLTR